ncbi:MAG: hypothetical protein ACLQLT_14970 [Methylovirgula sp.]
MQISHIGTVLSLAAGAAAILWAAVVMGAKDAQANAAMAQRTGKSCVFCHTTPPNLNDRGKRFKASGYKSWN